MTDPEARAADAVGTAEIARDMLTYALKDAAKVSFDAQILVLRLTKDGHHAAGDAFGLSARAVALETKITDMLARLDAMLIPAVAAEGQAWRNRTGRMVQ